MGFWDRLRGKRDKPDVPPSEANDDAVSTPPPGLAEEPEAADDAREHAQAAETQAAVDGYWDQIGMTDGHRISYLINPMFSGAPAWPNTRQSYRVVRTEQTVIIASDGLSDPGRDDTERSGFGCEVYIETADLAGADFEQIKTSPYFTVIENFAQNVANLGGISDKIEQFGVLSMEFPLGDLLPSLSTEHGSVGGLIGLPAGRNGTIDAPLGRVDFVPVTLISPAELEAVVAGGAAARAEIAAQREAAGVGHLTAAVD
ncbi:hypothetical protein ACF3NT_05005 [Naumannella halotolerans]|uniref:hypothetical protein n=1 Tax=Naumannella halotolerans TaxID=993414 RepID=UPI00370D6039